MRRLPILAVMAVLAAFFVLALGFATASWATHEYVTEYHPWSATFTDVNKGRTTLYTSTGTITDIDPLPHPVTVTVTESGTTTTEPPPPPPVGCAVDRANMTAPGCTILREDTAAVADPLPGLWGQLAAGQWPAGDPSRHVYKTTGGSTHLRPNVTPQGNTAYRELTTLPGDDWFGPRTELGRNNRASGENTGTQTAGTLALYSEGQHKITFFSMRFGAGFTSASTAWQIVGQMKSAQPYAANGPINGSVALEWVVDNGVFGLHNWWQSKWETTPPANGVWFRVAVDATYSKDPTVGKVQIFVDNDGDNDFLDADEASPVITCATLGYATTSGSGLNVGDPIPDVLMMGPYHDPSYGSLVVDLDNVQVVG